MLTKAAEIRTVKKYFWSSVNTPAKQNEETSEQAPVQRKRELQREEKRP